MAFDVGKSGHHRIKSFGKGQDLSNAVPVRCQSHIRVNGRIGHRSGEDVHQTLIVAVELMAIGSADMVC